MVATICERVCRMLRRRGLMGEASLDSNEVRLPEEALDGCRTVALSRGDLSGSTSRAERSSGCLPTTIRG